MDPKAPPCLGSAPPVCLWNSKKFAFQLHISPLDPHVPHETWGLGVENFIFFQTHMRGCAFVRGVHGWQKAPWAVQCPFKKMGFGQSPNYPAFALKAHKPRTDPPRILEPGNLGSKGGGLAHVQHSVVSFAWTCALFGSSTTQNTSSVMHTEPQTANAKCPGASKPQTEF